LAERWCYGYRPRLHVVDFHPVAEEIRARADPALWQLLLKRRMLRVAAGLCGAVKAQALVTGESIGQVSSQTLHNLAALDAPIGRPALRPLLTWNKEEILDLARRIGTHDPSAKVHEYCALEAHRPETHVKPDRLDRAEADLDPELARILLDARTILDARTLAPALRAGAAAAVGGGPGPELEVRDVPEDAVLLDLRPRRSFDAWHPPAARHADYPRILEEFTTLDPDRTYITFCELGLKSAHLAEVMGRAGYRVFHLAGNWKRLLHQHGAERDPMLSAALSPALLGTENDGMPSDG
ncbi:MAG: hypothetical protein MI919_28740, partial [Holophagales bacterium]|nr:hypothetical protein [Holophagales bacterium]